MWVKYYWGKVVKAESLQLKLVSEPLLHSWWVSKVVPFFWKSESGNLVLMWREVAPTSSLLPNRHWPAGHDCSHPSHSRSPRQRLHVVKWIHAEQAHPNKLHFMSHVLFCLITCLWMIEQDITHFQAYLFLSTSHHRKKIVSSKVHTQSHVMCSIFHIYAHTGTMLQKNTVLSAFTLTQFFSTSHIMQILVS